MGKPQLIQLPNYQNYQNAINVKTPTISWIPFPLSQSYQFFLRKICIVSIKPNKTESKEKKKIDLLSNITLEVTTNFVSARLLQKPIRLKIKKQKTKKKTFLYNGLSCEKK